MSERRRSERAFLLLAVIGNILAAPLYWQELMPLVQRIVRNPTGALTTAAVVAFVVSALVAFSWSRSVRVGAAVQLSVLVLPLSRIVSTNGGRLRAPAYQDATDVRFLAALILMCVVPGVLMAMSALALRRRVKKNNDA